MGWEQRNADFCKAQTDAQMAYIEAEREVDQLQTENDRLREEVRYLKKGDVLHVLTDQEYIDQCERERLMQVSIDALDDENAKLRQLVRDVVLLAGVNGCDVTKMQLCVHGGDWRTVWERMRELGVEV